MVNVGVRTFWMVPTATGVKNFKRWCNNNVKCDKIKLKVGIDREKSGFIHLDELSN